ncbi:MAG: anaerobic glycerol-3-phosphate dehydrogenase subunit C [Anaerolineae bacterium]|nr:anaerobic glycerol-3-phosphate dehydrogenase subunit C [Anaerolineae bacterium]
MTDHDQPVYDLSGHTPLIEQAPLARQAAFSADHCLKCNICTAACPVAAVTPLFPGPKTVGPQAQRLREPGQPSPDHAVDYCSSCGICTLVCPHGVKVMEINTQAKARIVERDGLSLRNWFLSRNELWGRLGTPFAPLLNFGVRSRLLRLLAEKLFKVSARGPLPGWAGYTFRGWWQREQKQHPRPAQHDDSQRVVFFHGCSTNTYEPFIGKLAVAVLEHIGLHVEIPPQTCCGLPAQSNGDFDAARCYARHNIEALADYARRGIPIVGTSASCMTAIKGDYRHVLGLDDDDAQLVAVHTYDFMEFLWKLHQEGRLPTGFQPIEREYPYHAPCQLKAHGFGRPVLDVLSLIPGLKAWEIDADCCGIAGTYGYKAEKRAIAELVGWPLAEQVHAAGAGTVICDTETCRWQITALTGANTIHPVELVAAAYGLTITDKAYTPPVGE